MNILWIACLALLSLNGADLDLSQEGLDVEAPKALGAIGADPKHERASLFNEVSADLRREFENKHDLSEQCSERSCSTISTI